MFVPTSQEQGFQFLHILANDSLLVGVKWLLPVVLIGSSLVISDSFVLIIMLPHPPPSPRGMTCVGMEITASLFVPERQTGLSMQRYL